MPTTKKLGKYELRRELGKGAMGIVYEGFDPHIQRVVAIKTIQKSLVEPGELQESLARFRREAQAAGRLSHPKVVAIYDYGEANDLAYIAMEYVAGKELKSYLDAGEQFEIAECLRIILQLLDALDYSHKRGVIHRDIKPANIMIGEDGNIKVADFGIAKIDNSHLTQAGMVLGTPTFMSPEQFMGKEIDGRSDLYSAGVTLYQILTGERPFMGSSITIMNKVLHQMPVPPSHYNPKITPELDAVVMHSMAKAAADRYQNAKEFMRAIKQVAPHFAVTASSADSTITKPLKVAPAPLSAPDINTREHDIRLWKQASEHNQRADYEHYLAQFPQGEFQDLARLRLSHIEQAESVERQAAERQRQQSLIAAEREKQLRTTQAQEEEAKRVQQETNARAQALAEARRREEQAHKAKLAQSMMAVKAAAEREKKMAADKQAQAAAEQARRQQELAALSIEHTKRVAAALNKRAAEEEANDALAKESRRKLLKRALQSGEPGK